MRVKQNYMVRLDRNSKTEMSLYEVSYPHLFEAIHSPKDWLKIKPECELALGIKRLIEATKEIQRSTLFIYLFISEQLSEPKWDSTWHYWDGRHEYFWKSETSMTLCPS